MDLMGGRKPFVASNRRMGNKCHTGQPPQLESSEPVQIALKPAPPVEPATRSHLRAVQTKSRSRFG